jgi:hypothetical protein
MVQGSRSHGQKTIGSHPAPWKAKLFQEAPDGTANKLPLPGFSKRLTGEMPVPRYFFDTYDGSRLINDPEGMELPNLEQVKAEAQNALPDLARDALPDGDQKTFIVSVRDEAGQVILRAALTLIVETAP